MSRAALPSRGPAGAGKSAFLKLGPRQNQLLATLPAACYERLVPHLEFWPVAIGTILCDTGDVADHAYFPTTSIISMQQELAEGAMSEVAVAGRDGMVGISIFTGLRSNTRAICHSAGLGYRMRSELLRSEFDHSVGFRDLLLRYAQVRIAQIAQTVVCYRHHSVDQQVSRRLLMNLDRLISSEIAVTHELMAATLGVRREAVTLATCRLQTDGLIRCSRGRITVVDRRRLAARACECYEVLNREAARLLPVSGNA